MLRHIFYLALIAIPQLLGQTTVFQCPGSTFTVAEGINNNGTVVGYYYLSSGGGAHGFVYTAGGCTNFDIPGASNTLPQAINSDGTVSGYYLDAASVFHWFLRSAAGGAGTTS